MRKFIFKLQTVFDVREKKEKAKKLEYSKALEDYKNKNIKLNELKSTFKSTLNESKKEINNRINPELIKMYNKYLTSTKKNIEKHQIEVKELEKISSIKKNEMLKAIADRKAIEKLKDNEYGKYVKEQNIEEQKVIEEIVNYKFVSK